MRRDWTLGMAAVACTAAVVAAGGLWAFWATSPALFALAATWTATTGACVATATRNLRAELTAAAARLAAFNGSESRDDLAVVGPISPPGGVRMVGSGDVRMVGSGDVRMVGSGDITTGGQLRVREGATGWLGPDDVSWDYESYWPLPDTSTWTVDGDPEEMARHLWPGRFEIASWTEEGAPLPEVDHDRLRRALSALPDGTLEVDGTFQSAAEAIDHPCAECSRPGPSARRALLADPALRFDGRPHIPPTERIDAVLFALDRHGYTIITKADALAAARCANNAVVLGVSDADPDLARRLEPNA
jgi:hypothetical protein